MKMPPDFSKAAELALKLKNSETADVAELAKEVLLLEAAYGELRQICMSQTAELVMRRHEHLLKKLAKHDIGVTSDESITLTSSGKPTDE